MKSEELNESGEEGTETTFGETEEHLELKSSPVPVALLVAPDVDTMSSLTQDETSGKPKRRNPRYECKICGKVLSGKYWYDNHMQHHTGKYRHVQVPYCLVNTGTTTTCNITRANTGTSYRSIIS